MGTNSSDNILVLILVAVLTGFLIPAILKFYETTLQRQVTKNTEIRTRQLEILEQLTRIIWEWRFLAKQVCYFGCDYKNSPADNEKFNKAVTDYRNKIWIIATEVKAVKSKSIVWFPDSVVNEIELLYFLINGLDSSITELIEKSLDENSDLSKEFLKKQAEFSKMVSPEIEEHIRNIAGTIIKPKL